MTRNARTDAHRPSTLIPAHYVPRMHYSLAHECDGWPQPPINIDRVVEIQREAHAAGKATFGTIGNCGVCGAHYKHGILFLHEPTGELVHMGEDCAAKYEAMVDWSAIELEKDRVHRATAKEIQRAANERARAEFLDQHPGLELALEAGKKDARDLQIAADDFRTLGAHAILADLAHKFTRFCELSVKQVQLAMRLYTQVTTPPAERPVDVKMPVPALGRVTFVGEIVSVKLFVSEQWGASWKCTVKVTHHCNSASPCGDAARTGEAGPCGSDGAIWLAWGSVPRDLLDQALDTEAVRAARYSGRRDDGEGFERAVRAELRGLQVAVTATLEASSDRTDEYTGQVTKKADPSFAFMKRPKMTVCGLYDHPTKAPAKRGKRTKKPTEECTTCGAIHTDVDCFGSVISL